MGHARIGPLAAQQDNLFRVHQREGIMEAVNTVIQPEKSRRRVLLKLSGEVFGGGKLGVP
jgi:hypothetical protein